MSCNFLHWSSRCTVSPRPPPSLGSRSSTCQSSWRAVIQPQAWSQQWPWSLHRQTENAADHSVSEIHSLFLYSCSTSLLLQLLMWLLGYFFALNSASQEVLHPVCMVSVLLHSLGLDNSSPRHLLSLLFIYHACCGRASTCLGKS